MHLMIAPIQVDQRLTNNSKDITYCPTCIFYVVYNAYTYRKMMRLQHILMDGTYTLIGTKFTFHHSDLWITLTLLQNIKSMKQEHWVRLFNHCNENTKHLFFENMLNFLTTQMKYEVYRDSQCAHYSTIDAMVSMYCLTKYVQI